MTKHRKKQLYKIANDLIYANLPWSCVEDEVSICETVSRGFDLHAGEELTLEEASFIYELMNQYDSL